MNKYGIHSLLTLIVLGFFTAITIIEFIHYNNQTWHWRGLGFSDRLF